MRTSTYGPVLIAFAALLWGLDGILRRSLGGLPPSTIVLYEHLAGLLLLLPFWIPFLLKRERFTRREWAALAFVSVLSSVFGTIWFTAALLKTNFLPFSVVFLLQKLQPLFAILGAALVLKERMDRRYLAWAAVALVAAYFVTFRGGHINFSADSATIVAAAFAVLAAFAWGFSTPFSRYLLLNHKATTVTGWRFLLGAVTALVVVLISGNAGAMSTITGSSLARIILIALSTGMVALWIYYRGLRFTEARVATILELVSPLTAIAIDFFVYDTLLAPSQYLAAAVLVYSTWQIVRQRSS